MQTNDWEGGAPTDLADRDDANPELERALESFRQEQERWERQLRLSAERIDQAEAEVFKLRKSLERVRETMSYRLGYSLLHSGRSWSNLVELPKTIMTLIDESRARRGTSGRGPAATLLAFATRRLRGLASLKTQSVATSEADEGKEEGR